MVKNTPLISLFLPFYAKILALTPRSTRFLRHKKCHPVVTLFVTLLSLCWQKRAKNVYRCNTLSRVEKGGQKRISNARCNLIPNTQKRPPNKPFTAVQRAKFNLFPPQLNFCNKKRASSPSKIKPKFKFWYSLF